MHHTVKYEGDDAANMTAALRDCRFYLGNRYQVIRRHLLNQLREDPTLSEQQHSHQAAMLLSFVGISGIWPVRAMVADALALGKRLDKANAKHPKVPA